MATPIVSTLDLHHRVDGFIVRIVEASLQEGVCLFLQGIQIEFRAATLAEQKAVQEGYSDITI
jgi:hypothetical protein